MNVINKIQIKRQQNTEFINSLIQNHKISINEGSSLQQITSPRLDAQQSISSSNMTDQIISMFNQRQPDIHKSDIHKSPSNVYSSRVQNEEQLDTRGQEADGMINEIDGLLEKIKKKYNMNYPLNEMQQHMQIKTEEEVTQQASQDTETDEQFRNIMNRIQKNDKNTPIIQNEYFSNKQKRKETSDYNLKSQIKDKIYIEHNIHIPRPKSAYQIEQEMEQETQHLKKENDREATHYVRNDNFLVDEKERTKNQKTKQNLHELQKKFKEVNKSKINSEEKNKIVDHINDHIDNSSKKNITKVEYNVSEMFETPQKSINLEIQSNLSYSQSAVSDQSQSSYSQLSQVSNQFTLKEMMANDGILQSLIAEESKLIVELQILKFKLQEIN